MKHPIDDYFEKGLESLEITPSANLFADKIAPKVAPEKKKAVVWYRAAAIIILLLSTWFAVNYFGKSGHVSSLENQQPIATEEVIVTPTVEESNLVETKSDLPVEEVMEKQIAEGAVEKESARNTEKRIKKQPVQIATVEEAEVIPESEIVVEKTKPTYKVKLSLNSLKYAALDEPVEESPADESVKDYAKSQWKNIKNGEKLEAPAKEWISLPKLAVRFEGNPIRGVLGE